VIASRLDERPLVWRSAALRLILALFPLWCTAAVVVLETPWRQKAIVGGVAAVTSVSPAAGLLAVAALAPFGAILEAILGLPFRISEEIVLAFLGVWLLRATLDRHGPRIPASMATAGWLLGASVLSSVAVLVYRGTGDESRLASIAIWLRQAYYLVALPIGLVDAMRVIEGLGLVAATLFQFRQRPSLAVSLPTALCASGAIAAALGVLIYRGVGPAFLVERYSTLGYRTAYLSDPNAAGSYFALTLCLAIGMAVRQHGRERILFAALALLNLIGVRYSESKSAFMASAVLLVLAAAWLALWRRPLRTRLAALALLLAVGLGAASVRARLLEQDPTFQGSGFRSEFNATSARMIAARPIAGIGIGQYYATSALFLSPRMAFTYGRENAHNYFLQIGAELGLIGLVLFAAWIGGASVIIGRALAHSSDARLVGGAAGVAALLATCLTGHPLLVSEVVYPFWIAFAVVLGLAASPAVDASANATRPRHVSRPGDVVAVAAMAALIAVATGASAHTPVSPPTSQDVTGFYDWETAEDGAPFRWMRREASIFVPDTATRVRIPVRLPYAVRPVSPLGVWINIAGKPLYRTLAGMSWVDLDVPLPGADRSTHFIRVNLQVDRTWQPAIYVAGSADMRQLGVQVGRCRIEEWSGPQRPDAHGC
jgi:O-antigen ligase